jgi:hypothetical protein
MDLQPRQGKLLRMNALLTFLHKRIKGSADNRAGYIFYKIIGSTSSYGIEHYQIQCINKKAIFHAKISDIISDRDILHGLHHVQACYVGMEYARELKAANKNTASTHPHQAFSDEFFHRYGCYSLRLQDRKGNISFIHKKSGKHFLMDPREIALSKEIIEEFDASQAFYIGLLSGIKLNNTAPVFDNTASKAPPFLYIVR